MREVSRSSAEHGRRLLQEEDAAMTQGLNSTSLRCCHIWQDMICHVMKRYVYDVPYGKQHVQLFLRCFTFSPNPKPSPNPPPSTSTFSPTGFFPSSLFPLPVHRTEKCCRLRLPASAGYCCSIAMISGKAMVQNHIPTRTRTKRGRPTRSNNTNAIPISYQ